MERFLALALILLISACTRAPSSNTSTTKAPHAEQAPPSTPTPPPVDPFAAVPERLAVASADPSAPLPPAFVVIPKRALSPRHAVVIETPHKVGQASAPESDTERQQIASWNRGGRAGKWHPEPRVTVNTVKVSGRIKKADVLREARRQGYARIRRCYDAGLLENQDLKGKMRVSFEIRHTGTAVRPTLAGRPTLKNKTVVRCIRRSWRKVKFPPTRRGSAKVTLEILVYPGDAPMRDVKSLTSSPGPGKLDMAVVQALIAGQAGGRIQQCFDDAVERTPGLWGRMVLVADVAPNGSVLNVNESSSTFPHPQTTRCAADAVKNTVLPPSPSGELRLVVPIRFGDP